jgi:hypothetical protein
MESKGWGKVNCLRGGRTPERTGESVDRKPKITGGAVQVRMGGDL